MTTNDALPRACRDCGVEPAQAHVPGCDVARCLWTGMQELQCDGGLTAACCRALRAAGHDDLGDKLAHYLGLDDPDHDCGRDVWTGEFPGRADARSLGWWCRWSPGAGWVRCDPDHADARPDLNRLVTDARWDRTERKWVAP